MPDCIRTRKSEQFGDGKAFEHTILHAPDVVNDQPTFGLPDSGDRFAGRVIDNFDHFDAKLRLAET